jgi:hypothetical protein
VMPERIWWEAAGKTAQRQPMGRWLLDHIPRGEELPVPSRSDGAREIPFADEDGE